MDLLLLLLRQEPRYPGEPAAVAAAARRLDPLQAEEGGEEAHRFVRMAAMLSQRFTAVIIFHGKEA